MKRISMVVAATLFMLTVPFANSLIRAERADDSQAADQSQQGQGQQGQSQQGSQQAQGQQGAKSQNVSLRKFVITLALGDVEAGTGSAFAPAAAKALADLKGFLPYKTYTLLDTVFRIGLTGPTVQMKGMGQVFELITFVNAATQNKTSVRVQLRTITTSDQPKWLIDTQFDIEIGETVVVGTSRLDGNRALLLLVTSAP